MLLGKFLSLFQIPLLQRWKIQTEIRAHTDKNILRQRINVFRSLIFYAHQSIWVVLNKCIKIIHVWVSRKISLNNEPYIRGFFTGCRFCEPLNLYCFVLRWTLLYFKSRSTFNVFCSFIFLLFFFSFLWFFFLI